MTLRRDRLRSSARASAVLTAAAGISLGIAAIASGGDALSEALSGAGEAERVDDRREAAPPPVEPTRPAVAPEPPLDERTPPAAPPQRTADERTHPAPAAPDERTHPAPAAPDERAQPAPPPEPAFEEPIGDEPVWPYALPIWGEDAARRGYAPPLPIGVAVLGNYQVEQIAISKLRVALGDQPFTDARWVRAKKVETTSETVLARLDVWIFPFWNVYGLAGLTRATTDVVIDQPVILPTTVVSDGPTYGFGSTLVAGNEWGFLLVDASWTWTALDILDRPQQTIVGAARVGHRFTISETHGVRLAVWVGIGYEYLKGETVGQLRFGDVLGGRTTLELSPDVDAYVASLPEQQRTDLGRVLGQALNVATGPDPQSQPTSFRLRVRPEEPFNMLAGLQLEATPRVQVLAEAGFLGTRTSGTASIGVRFGF